uniref:Uncharacterized protein n=1 Tax=Trichogramma kaykai TaxID=54128 RepID=A0ABD2X5Y3_9HYME
MKKAEYEDRSNKRKNDHVDEYVGRIDSNTAYFSLSQFETRRLASARDLSPRSDAVARIRREQQERMSAEIDAPAALPVLTD